MGLTTSERVWHYTSINAALNILDSRTVRATDVRHVSDPTEWDTAYNRMLEAVDQVIDDPPVGSHRKRASSFLRETKAILNAAVNDEKFASYVVCCTQETDDERHWSERGRPGVALVFEAVSALRARRVPWLASEATLVWQQMAYQNHQVMAMVRHNCFIYLARKSLLRHDRQRDLAAMLFYNCGAIKRPCFDWEREVRLTLRAAMPIRPGEHVHRGADGTASFVELPLIDEATNCWRLIEVVSGPTALPGQIGQLRTVLEDAALPSVRLRASYDQASDRGGPEFGR